MKKRYALFLILATVAACSSCFTIPDPVPGSTKPGTNTGTDNNGGDENSGDENQTTGRGFILEADGDDANTYSLITEKGFGYETPDCSGAHAENPFRHIRQSYDATLKKHVFDFYLHIENDDDRGLANITDRQRNEIKTYAHSPDSLVAQYGEALTMRWKFKLPVGMQTTSKFAHIHQLKGIDNKAGTADVSLPAITFTCRSMSNGKQQMQVLYTASNIESDGGSTYLARLDLADFLGEWVSVTETVTFADEGSYSVKIVRMRDGKVLANVENAKLDMWRKDCTGMRPKWGLYRNFGEKRALASQLRDEILKFADFDIEKLK